MKATPTRQGCFGKLARAEKLINELRRQNLNFFKKAISSQRLSAIPKRAVSKLVANQGLGAARKP